MAKKALAANRDKTAKSKRRRGLGKPFTGKGDPRNNLAGRPKDGESWGAVLKELSNLNADELAEMVGGNKTDLGRQLLLMPKGVQMKYLVSIRAMTSLMFEPASALWNSLLDRVEGKVPDTMIMDAKIQIEGFAGMLEKIYGSEEAKPSSG